ncbi:acyltransferase [Streptomyces sp. CB01881]|uniref:acyltransferase family protein n=1 Tax=Streptomyces sp. CB01881 TaxID=2078691 RepID=UPI000CDBD2E9|nr:acyltransferase [Streptomyces sp. CB01881]AUY52713.1 acyltransferase [Streptomyces sp. CB01881]TYC70431.1 acyltransferase [Streptomyces sp. CB01881]
MPTPSGTVPQEQRTAGAAGPSALARLPSLTGLRFVAICVVFASHAALFGALRTGRDYSVLYPLGALGVSLFFILSGFVLTYSARSGDTAPAFWRRRFVKIYPAHLVAWTAVMLLIWAGNVPRVPPGSAPPLSHDLANLFLVNTVAPGWWSVDGGNGVAWSLVCELFFYALFPVLLPLVRRIRPEWLVAGAVAAVAAAWLVPLLALGLGGAATGSPLGADLSVDQLFYAYFWPVGRLPEFVLGMVLARLAVHRPRTRVGIVPSAALVVAVLAAGPHVLSSVFLLTAVTVVPLALLIRATAAADLNATRSLLRSPQAVFLGDISYAFYLLHFTAFMALYHYLPQSWPNALLVVLVFVLGQLAAWLLHARVEVPGMRRFAVSRARRRAAAPSSAAGHP